MAALNRIQSPSAIGQPPFHVGVCGSSWKARCCSVSAALASVGPASGSPAKPHFSQPNGEGVLLLCWLKSGRFVARDTVQVDGIDGVGVIARSTCVPMSRQTVQNRCVLCVGAGGYGPPLSAGRGTPTQPPSPFNAFLVTTPAGSFAAPQGYHQQGYSTAPQFGQ